LAIGDLEETTSGPRSGQDLSRSLQRAVTKLSSDRLRFVSIANVPKEPLSSGRKLLALVGICLGSSANHTIGNAPIKCNDRSLSSLGHPSDKEANMIDQIPSRTIPIQSWAMVLAASITTCGVIVAAIGLD
jgi:hypothetical protein